MSRLYLPVKVYEHFCFKTFEIQLVFFGIKPKTETAGIQAFGLLMNKLFDFLRVNSAFKFVFAVSYVC
jgi:hypothetical protein